MTKRYTGGVVSSSLPTVNAAAASGVFLLSQQADYQSRNAWPPYKVEESLRFRSADSAYLNRTPASVGNRRIWTWSGWVKRGSLSSGSYVDLFTALSGANDFTEVRYHFNANDDTLVFTDVAGGTTYGTYSTNVYRDPSAWYHVVCSVDTTQATNTNRVKLYVNGVQVTQNAAGSGYPSQNTNTSVNAAVEHRHGSIATYGRYFDGYMSEVNFVDGQALTPSSFGATDKDGNWSPIAYTGTYGTNGFYVNFRDNTSATTMGYDYSGNGNNWTLNGFNVSTANTTYDIMIDVPEDQNSANTRGNYCTMNPLMEFGSNLTWTNGNLRVSKASASTTDYTYGTIGVSSGKWYWEMTITAFAGTSPVMYFGVARGLNVTAAYDETAIWYASDGTKTNRASASYNQAYGSSYTTNDVIAVALDLDAGTITFYKNNVSQGVAYSNLGSYPGLYMAYVGFDGASNSATTEWNFGQRPFTYAPPSGFKTLNTFNLPEPTIKQPNQYFDVNLWTGNATNRAITNAGEFQPDFVWIKHRSSAENHNLYDGIRGPGNRLESNDTAPDFYYSDRLTAFNSNGFNLGTGYNNTNGTTYVGWQWRGSSANATNTSGSITSIVRANQTAGFSIVTFTTVTSGTSSVGHGLGVTPNFVIFKTRGITSNWICQHTSTGTQYLLLNGTGAATTDSTVWNSAPTSSIVNMGTGFAGYSGATAVMYCFSAVAGYSAFGSYTGNGSTDGPFVYTGFRPKWILMKSTTETGLQWSLWDSSRIGYNPSNYHLAPQSSAAEDTTNSGSNSNGGPDFLSNGFKMRSNGGSHNSSGATYIYAAFAEAPFKYARSR